MKCECTQCPECHGTGNAFISFSGEYMGSGRCDDLDELVTCERCDGSGLDYFCRECQQAAEDAEAEAEERDRQEELRNRY